MYALKPGGVIPPSGFGYFDVILDKYCLFAVFNKSFDSIGLCLSELIGRNLFPHPAYHHHSGVYRGLYEKISLKWVQEKVVNNLFLNTF